MCHSVSLLRQECRGPEDASELVVPAASCVVAGAGDMTYVSEAMLRAAACYGQL